MSSENSQTPEQFKKMISRQRDQYVNRPYDMADHVLSHEVEANKKDRCIELVNQVLAEKLLQPRTGTTTETKLGRDVNGYRDYLAKRQMVESALKNRNDQPLLESQVKDTRESNRKPIHIELFPVIEASPGLSLLIREAHHMAELLKILYSLQVTDFKTPADTSVESVGVTLQPFVQTSAGEVALPTVNNLSAEDTIRAFAQSLEWSSEFVPGRDIASLLEADQMRNRLSLSQVMQEREAQLRDQGKQPVLIPVYITRDFLFQREFRYYGHRIEQDTEALFPAVFYAFGDRWDSNREVEEYNSGAVIGGRKPTYNVDVLKKYP